MKKLIINQERAETFIDVIAKNDFYCPCIIPTKESKESGDNLCICKKVRDYGECCCGLYEWVEADE